MRSTTVERASVDIRLKRGDTMTTKKTAKKVVKKAKKVSKKK